LEPTTDVQRELRSRVLQLVRDLSELRLMLFSHFSSSVPLPFLAIVLLWVIVIFTGFSLMAPPRPISVTSLFVCAISVAGAIFLILELDQPFTGIMTIPSDALERALPPIEAPPLIRAMERRCAGSPGGAVRPARRPGPADHGRFGAADRHPRER
jgi:hypothetical protein